MGRIPFSKTCFAGTSVDAVHIYTGRKNLTGEEARARLQFSKTIIDAYHQTPEYQAMVEELLG